MRTQQNDDLLDSLERLHPGERLQFECKPGVACFNACCADLSLELSPYDVLRLRRALGLPGRELLFRYTDVAADAQTGFPVVHLRMQEDRLLSCPFVTPSGCSLYADRPGACRTYPLGRGAGLDPQGRVLEELVIVREPHCLGFGAGASHSGDEWMQAQGLAPYNRMNDRFMRLLAACGDRGVRLDHSRYSLALAALYQLDELPELMDRSGAFAALGFNEERRRAVLADEEALLLLAIAWLERLLCAPGAPELDAACRSDNTPGRGRRRSPL